jgi:carbamoyl-phosphate synthase large subunit
MTAVLFTCAGRRVDIVTAFGRAGATTVAADLNPLAPTLYHADHQAFVPRVEDAGYIPKLREVIATYDVRLVVPLTDLDQEILARARDHGELGTEALLPRAEVVERVNDKYRAHQFFEENGVHSPPSWLPDELPEDLEFPVMVKARKGYGSQHIYRAEDREHLDFFLGYTQAESFVQKCCRGEEFSIDVFSDLDGRCLSAIPRTMIESRGGESIKGMTIKDWDLIEYGAHVAETLGLAGPATVQCFREDGDRHEVTDVNPRFGGAFPLPLAAGSRYPELAIALAEGEHPEPRLGDFREGVMMTRFLSHLTLTTAEDGTLEPFSEDVPEPIASEPGEA